MENQPPRVVLSPGPPPFPESPTSIDLSPLEFILALLALVIIPILIYTFFFFLECSPSNPFNRTNRRSTHNPGHTSSPGRTPTSDNQTSTLDSNSTDKKEAVLDIKYNKDTHVREIGSECPVCLSVFVDGEEVKQLKACNHSFHSSCIDLWLSSHSNCPVCRAFVKRPSTGGDRRRASANGRDADDDFRQGLPDASTLV